VENKKGQGLSITTLILIIIGVVILVVLIFGFTASWDNIKGWLAPSSNVDQIVSACSVACAADQTYDWCNKEMTLKEKGMKDIKVRCRQIANVVGSLNSRYGVEDCSSIPNDGCVRTTVDVRV